MDYGKGKNGCEIGSYQVHAGLLRDGLARADGDFIDLLFVKCALHNITETK